MTPYDLLQRRGRLSEHQRAVLANCLYGYVKRAAPDPLARWQVEGSLLMLEWADSRDGFLLITAAGKRALRKLIAREEAAA